MADESGNNATHPSCPKCSSRDVVPVVFGLYDDAGLASLRREYGDGGFVLGGCIVGYRAWDWSCKACGAKFSDDLQFIEKPAKQFSELEKEMKARVEKLKAEGKMPHWSNSRTQWRKCGSSSSQRSKRPGLTKVNAGEAVETAMMTLEVSYDHRRCCCDCGSLFGGLSVDRG